MRPVSGSNVPLRLKLVMSISFATLLTKLAKSNEIVKWVYCYWVSRDRYVLCHLSELPRFWECIGGEGGVNDGHDSR